MAHINLRYKKDAIRQRWGRVAGFTLLELVFTIALIGILAVIGIPSFSEMLERNRTVRLAEELKGFLVQAKSESVMRNKTLSLTAKSNSGFLSAGTDYTDGEWYIALHDPADSVSTLALASDNAIAILQGSNFKQGALKFNVFSAASSGKLADIDARRGSPDREISISVSDSSQELKIFGNDLTGRVYSCSVGGNAYGYNEC